MIADGLFVRMFRSFLMKGFLAVNVESFFVKAGYEILDEQ